MKILYIISVFLNKCVQNEMCYNFQIEEKYFVLERVWGPRERLLLLLCPVGPTLSKLFDTFALLVMLPSSWPLCSSDGDGTCRWHSNAQVSGVSALGCQSTIDNDVPFSLKCVLFILP